MCVHVSAVKMSYLSAVPCSRCLIFWRKCVVCVCSRECCQDVSSFGSSPFKMSHLLAGSVFVCVFMRVLSRCLKYVVCVCSRECCQDVSSFGSSPFKMSHLLAGSVLFV